MAEFTGTFLHAEQCCGGTSHPCPCFSAGSHGGCGGGGERRGVMALRQTNSCG